jgi:hypothetical protein
VRSEDRDVRSAAAAPADRDSRQPSSEGRRLPTRSPVKVSSLSQERAVQRRPDDMMAETVVPYPTIIYEPWAAAAMGHHENARKDDRLGVVLLRWKQVPDYEWFDLAGRQGVSAASFRNVKKHETFRLTCFGSEIYGSRSFRRLSSVISCVLILPARCHSKCHSLRQSPANSCGTLSQNDAIVRMRNGSANSHDHFFGWPPNRTPATASPEQIPRLAAALAQRHSQR